jgi:mono/diheme cytochrome c family protein
MRIVKIFVCSVFLLTACLLAFDPAGLAKKNDAGAANTSAQNICMQWPLPLPSQIGADKYQQLLNQYVTAECYKKEPGMSKGGWRSDTQIRDTGPFIANKTLGTHNAVKVYYSGEVVRWLTSGRKEGDLRDGATIIKEMYPNPAQQQVAPGTKCTDNIPPNDNSYRCKGLAIMVRDEQGAWDGWFWSDGSPQISYASYPNAGFGLYCVNCHASAKTDLTFSSMSNILGNPIVFNSPMQPNVIKPVTSSATAARAIASTIAPAQRLSAEEDLSVHLKRDARDDGPVAEAAAVTAARRSAPPVALARASVAPTPKQLVNEWYDTATQQPRNKPRQMFLTSNQCFGCHDATQNNASMPNMMWPQIYQTGKDQTKEVDLNLSPYSEWRSSMMGLAGRDPVFFAQLETEMNLHPEIAEQTVDTCLSCHGVMGQRQIHLDNKGMMRLEYLDQLTNQWPPQPFAEYGALARDGVSCAVCHHISAEGFGKLDPRFPPETPRFITDTGRFNTGKPEEIFGPYRDVATVPMDNSLGLTPMRGDQVKSSALCGTCHTVVLPVLEVGKKYPKDVYDLALNAKIETEHEQNTYIEWLNSDYQNEPTTARRPVKPAVVQTCQDCHMPTKYPSKTGKDLQFKVASIEEETFAVADFTAPDEDLHLRVRGTDAENRYSRHTLLGLNLFVMEIFNQFPTQLGISTTAGQNGLTSFFDPMATWGNPPPSMLLSKQSGVELARNETAKIEIASLVKTPRLLTAGVKVTNLAGHKFPSGVSFRRAFIEFRVEVRNPRGWTTVWASGATNECRPGGQTIGPVPCGVIGTLRNGQFDQPLVTEFFDKQTNPQQQYQPHYETITSEKQVQIYEELIKDSNGNFTTSFISLKDTVKDNRLMPLGWDKSNFFAATTRPHGEAANDPRYIDGSGTDFITYQVPAEVVGNRPYRVTATIYYQTIPPYYLQQRYAGAQAGPNNVYTNSLRWYVDNLDVTSNTDINIRNNPDAGWELLLKDQMPIKNWKLMITTASRLGT